MDSLDNTRALPPASSFHEAVFIDSATTPADTLMVVIPDFSADQPFGDPDGVVWSPMGGALPQAGDRALVAESTDGSWWVLSWWSDTQSTGVAESRVAALEARPRVARGQAACVFTDSATSAVATVAHGLGGTPSSVTFGAFDLNVDGIALTGVDSTNLQIQARYVSAVTGTATIMWTAAL